MSKLYEVIFYREVVGDYGRCKNVTLRVIQTSAPTRDLAAAIAKRKFEEESQITHWDSLATHFEVREDQDARS